MAWLNVIDDVLNWSAWLLRSPQYWEHQLCCCLSSLITSPHPQHLPRLGWYAYKLRYSHSFFQTRIPWLLNPCASLVPQPAKFQTAHRCPNGTRGSPQILQREYDIGDLIQLLFWLWKAIEVYRYLFIYNYPPPSESCIQVTCAPMRSHHVAHENVVQGIVIPIVLGLDCLMMFFVIPDICLFWDTSAYFAL